MPGVRGGDRLGRMVRGMRPDRNPLRRRTDRLETYLLAGLFAATAAGTPLAVLAASHAAYDAALQSRQEQLATRYQVSAVLTDGAGNAGAYTLTTEVPAAATWTSVSGSHLSGDVPVLAGSPRGTVVPVWTSQGGTLTSPPLELSQVAGDANAAAAGVIAGAGAACVLAGAAVRGVLCRRRMAAWEADWLATAPNWNRQRW